MQVAAMGIHPLGPETSLALLLFFPETPSLSPSQHSSTINLLALTEASGATAACATPLPICGTAWQRPSFCATIKHSAQLGRKF